MFGGGILPNRLFFPQGHERPSIFASQSFDDDGNEVGHLLRFALGFGFRVQGMLHDCSVVKTTFLHLDSTHPSKYFSNAGKSAYLRTT